MSRHITRMTLNDAEHIPAEQRQAIIDGYLPHMRLARVEGFPAQGSGAVFPFEEDMLRCEPFPIPSHFVQINGVDFGFDHPFAACHCAWDREDDIWYVCRTYRDKGGAAPIHAAAMRPWGAWVPTAWPHDGLQHDKGSGAQLAEQYRDNGVNMLHEHATHEQGGFGVEAGIAEMAERMQTGRWKVFAGNEDWFGEFRLYHREDGKIIKVRDDLLSASRYALMMRRFAASPPTSNERRERVNVSNCRYSFMGG
jgi:hypothetical protein